MKKVSHSYDLTLEEIEELMKQPLDEEDWDCLLQMDKDAEGLLALNLCEMDREENESDPD